MVKLFTLPEHRTRAPYDDKLAQTYLGQAHIAGTGPEGATCRECVFWGSGNRWKRYKANGGAGGGSFELMPSYCNKPIANKQRRGVPHAAKACWFFEARESPPEPVDQEKKQNHEERASRRYWVAKLEIARAKQAGKDES